MLAQAAVERKASQRGMRSPRKTCNILDRQLGECLYERTILIPCLDAGVDEDSDSRILKSGVFCMRKGHAEAAKKLSSFTYI